MEGEQKKKVKKKEERKKSEIIRNTEKREVYKDEEGR